MTTAEAITAAIEAKEAASKAWLSALKAMNEAYTDYLLANERGVSESEAVARYLALRKLERKASRADDKARKICKFLGVAE